MRHLTRRQFGAVVGGGLAAAVAPGSRRAGAQGPVTVSIIDSAGDLSSVREIVENYKKANPQKVKDVTYQRAPAPELPTKIKTQQDAGRVDINLVMTGQDAGFGSMVCEVGK